MDLLSISQEDLLVRMNRGVLYTPNLDHLVKLQYDKVFYDAYQQADWVICDSRILYWVSKLLKCPIPEPIPGSSFLLHFMSIIKIIRIAGFFVRCC